VIDDEQVMCDLVREALQARDFEVTTTTRPADALELVRTGQPDVVVTDLRMKEMTGLDLCRSILVQAPGIPVLMMTGFGTMEAAIGAIRAGAYDFLTKPIDMATLAQVVGRAVEDQRLLRRLSELREDSTPSPSLLIGHSPSMTALLALIRRASRSIVPVLICGESGTGKELAARALHDASPRRDGPFLAVNCAAIPATLLESELFGHVRGAFTDAKRARSGLILQAAGGTLFLDEIGDMPLALQPKLLRVLQERRYRPVGGDRELEVSCRIVSATHQDLAVRASEGSFRGDLYYRLNVIQLDIPPLRSRTGDILTLAHHFLRRAAADSPDRVEGMTPEFARTLLTYSWPGNVRELQNCIERAVALTSNRDLVPEDLPAAIRATPRSAVESSAVDTGLRPLDEVEREHILRVLNAVEGRRGEAAAILGIDRKTLYRKLERYALESPTED